MQHFIYLFYSFACSRLWSSDISGGYFPMDISGRVLNDLHLNESWGHLFHLCSYNLFIEEVLLGMLFVHNNHLFDAGMFCTIIISTPCV